MIFCLFLSLVGEVSPQNCVRTLPCLAHIRVRCEILVQHQQQLCTGRNQMNMWYAKEYNTRWYVWHRCQSSLIQPTQPHTQRTTQENERKRRQKHKKKYFVSDTRYFEWCKTACRESGMHKITCTTRQRHGNQQNKKSMQSKKKGGGFVIPRN